MQPQEIGERFARAPAASDAEDTDVRTGVDPVDNPDGTWVVAQHAHDDVADDRSTLLRVLCSGYRPAGV
jgi:hypothetical protein